MAANPIVKLSSDASLCGLNVFARNHGKPVKAFLGIPYAEPPARFMPPVPLLHLWTGIKMATKFGAICPQNIKALRSMYKPFPVPDLMSEDCLFLNVWTPTLDNSANLPVMVWIYGGTYINGCSNYYDGTAYAALHDVVFVSLNYRSGVLGFIASGDNVVQSNLGLLDQREALRWIQKYIRNFGGNPGNVTVFGESSGAINICWHMSTSGSAGLFNRAIVQSGSICFSLSVMSKERCRRHFEILKKNLGISESCGVAEAVRQLKLMPVSEIVSKADHRRFYAALDDVHLTTHPISLFNSGNFHKVDLLLGFNTNEGLSFVNGILKLKPRRQLTNEMAREMLGIIIFRKLYSNYLSAQKIYDLIWNEYFENVNAPDLLYQRLVEVYGNIMFIAPTIHLADLHSTFASGRSTFLYQFDCRPSFSSHPSWVTAAHGDEIPYVIGEPFLDRLPDVWSNDERNLSSLMMSMWSNFAKTGNPNTVGDDYDFYWPAYKTTARRFAVFDARPSIDQNFNSHRMNFHQMVIESIAERDRHLNSNL